MQCFKIQGHTVVLLIYKLAIHDTIYVTLRPTTFEHTVHYQGHQTVSVEVTPE
jgi:hypothetical protein